MLYPISLLATDYFKTVYHSSYILEADGENHAYDMANELIMKVYPEDEYNDHSIHVGDPEPVTSLEEFDLDATVEDIY